MSSTEQWVLTRNPHAQRLRFRRIKFSDFRYFSLHKKSETTKRPNFNPLTGMPSEGYILKVFDAIQV